MLNLLFEDWFWENRAYLEARYPGAILGLEDFEVFVEWAYRDFQGLRERRQLRKNPPDISLDEGFYPAGLFI